MEKKFIVEQKELLGLLSSMQPICSKRTALDATASILFAVGHKELVLKSTDLEISLQSNCLLTESVLEAPYAFLVSGKRIFEVVKELEGLISCTVTHHQITLSSGSVRLSLNIKDPQEFPPFPERIENIMPLNAPLFLQLLDSVSFLIPQNNTNQALNGLLLEIDSNGLTMTTTDGHCLAQVKSNKATFTDSRTWLLPRRAIYELKKILETSQDTTIFLGICGNQLVFSGELFNFFTKLLTDKFPQYQAILNKNQFLPASIDKAKFVKTLRRSACLLSGQFIATKFAFEEQSLRVLMQNKEIGALDEHLQVNDNALTLDIRFYAPYLLSGLQVFAGNDLTFYMKNSTSPMIFESVTDDYSLSYLVMPVSPTVNV